MAISLRLYCKISYPLTILFVFIFSFSNALVYGTSPDVDSLRTFSKIKNYFTKSRNYLIAPQFDRGPETGILTGIYYLQLFKHKKDSSVRTSNTETFLSVTQKQQYLAEFNETILIGKDKFILRGSSLFTRYNEYFYGIGNNIDLKQKDTIEFNLFHTTQRLTRVVNNKIFAGIQYQFYEVYNLGYKANDILDRTQPVGLKGSLTSGLGPVFLYDSRDNVIFSHTGAYLDISALFVNKDLGSQYNFTNFIFDARKFFEVYKRYVFCIQGLINYNWGQVPFRQLAQMGGDILMRGYYLGAYRDKTMMCGQVEMRVPLWKFIGMVLFAAAGEVEPTIHKYNWSDLKFTEGFGLRFMLIKHERVNVGGDLGFGKNTRGLYFGSGESF
jgi:hypothetical protein